MQGQLNYFQVRNAQAWGPGVTQKRHIAEIFGKKPVEMNNVMVRAFTANYAPTMTELIKKYTTVKEYESDDEYTWKLIGTVYKNIPLIEARDESGAIISASSSTMYGLGGSLIQLVFPEAYFADGEVIVGELNEYYQFRIVSEPFMEGSNAVYTVELMHGAENGVPAERLQPGERFSWEFAPVESELSRKAGGIRKFAPTTLRNEFTTIRKYQKYTGRADKQLKLSMAIPVMRKDANGKIQNATIDSWFSNEEWIFAQEWALEKERAFMYSRSNRNANGNYFNHGKSNNVIKEGDGIMAQMQFGNTYSYNDFGDNFSIKGLENALYDLCEIGNLPIDKRKFVITTGNRGMAQVNHAIRKETAGWAVLLDNSSVGVVKKVNNEVHGTSLAVGAQYTQIQSANGLILDFRYDASYDDRERNKIEGPNGQGVLNSYRYDIFDMGTPSEPNMWYCKIKGEEDTIKYRIGMRNPWGITGDIAYDEDSAEVHAMCSLGACVCDPTRCMSYIPAGLIC